MSERSLTELEEFFLALSDGTRLRLLSLMRNGEVSVNYLAEKLDTSQPKISRHLAYLRSAGLVETRRDGKWIYYHIARLASSFAFRTLNDALGWMGSITGEITAEGSIAQFERRDELPAPDRTESDEEESNWEESSYSNDIEIYLL
jgi:DNA-binding transcriptional ArsR family regulator